MSMLAVVCEPATDGVAVAPCGTIGGVAYALRVVHSDDLPPDFQNADTLFAYGLLPVLVFWAIGKSVGAIFQIIGKAGS